MSLDFLRKSSDGSISAYSAAFDECYHSIKDGALAESLHKHILPALLHIINLSLPPQNSEKNTESKYFLNLDSENIKFLPKVLNILDICFGLGYNTFTLLCTLEKLNFRGKINIYSPEIDREIFKKLLNFPFPKTLQDYQKDIDDLLNFSQKLEAKMLQKYKAFWGRKQNIELDFYLYIGDGLELLSMLEKMSFNIIFQDAFSPKKNARLWSEEYFQNLFYLLDKNGIITTYSQSSAIRKNALKSGLKVYDYDNSITRPGSVFGKDKIRLKNLREKFYN